MLNLRFPVKCSSCNRPMESPLFCGDCRALYRVDDCTLFEVMGLPARFDLDLGELRSRYLHLARDLHPDRLLDRSPADQETVLRNSARLNEAYEVLRDPIQRAEYLLELSGGESAAGDKSVPQSVLIEALSLREELDETRADSDAAVIETLRARVEGRYRELSEAIAKLARQLPGDEPLRGALRERLNSIRYFQRLRGEVSAPT